MAAHDSQMRGALHFALDVYERTRDNGGTEDEAGDMMLEALRDRFERLHNREKPKLRALPGGRPGKSC